MGRPLPSHGETVRIRVFCDGRWQKKLGCFHATIVPVLRVYEESFRRVISERLKRREVKLLIIWSCVIVKKVMNILTKQTIKSAAVTLPLTAFKCLLLKAPEEKNRLWKLILQRLKALMIRILSMKWSLRRVWNILQIRPSHLLTPNGFSHFSIISLRRIYADSSCCASRFKRSYKENASAHKRELRAKIDFFKEFPFDLKVEHKLRGNLTDYYAFCLRDGYRVLLDLRMAIMYFL